ncbi:MAG TPA: class I adenylate-forming enzyme family protein [Deferrisomatales bacterium]|nr:class I adenylate-forming enzyme family protein [Deferrisomatales bacterium]
MEEKYTLEGLRPDPARNELTFTRLYEMAERYPDHTALVFLGMRMSFRKLTAAIDRCAAAFAGIGVGHGDRVMIYLANCPQWVIANFAIQRLGAAVVPVSPIYTAHELEYLIQDAGVETVLCQDTNFGYVQEVLEKTCLKQIVVTNIASSLPKWKIWLGHTLDVIPTGKVPTGLHIHRWSALMRRAPAHPPEVKIDPWRDLASIMYTGGTTGFPKGVPGNHATEVGYIRDVMEEVLAGQVEEGKDRVLLVNPLYHIMAKGFMIAAGLNYGCTTVLMPLPHVDTLLREVERHKVRWFLGVPALYRMILENDRIDQYDLTSLTYCYCGGDVLPDQVFQRWRELTGSPIYQVYGSTEVGHVAYTRPSVEPQPDVIGHPLRSYRTRITDPETGEPVPLGEVGELWVTADFNLKCYWNKPEETAECYVPVGDETYYRMGDFVAEDESGQIRFMERTADVIKYKGYRISASEIEAALLDHPTVMGACAVGLADEAVGERIKAIVVLKTDAKGVSGDDLRKWCKERLAPYKLPHYIEFRDMLPKSKVGKLLRRTIRDEERRKAAG